VLRGTAAPELVGIVVVVVVVRSCCFLSFEFSKLASRRREPRELSGHERRLGKREQALLRPHAVPRPRSKEGDVTFCVEEAEKKKKKKKLARLFHSSR